MTDKGINVARPACRCFNRCLVLLAHLNERGERAVNALEPPLVRLLQDGAGAKRVPVVPFFQFFEQVVPGLQ
jgi:hypothetical protein